jgi:hypothetical protein
MKLMFFVLEQEGCFADSTQPTTHLASSRPVDQKDEKFCASATGAFMHFGIPRCSAGLPDG